MTELISYVFPLFTILISLLWFYHSALRGAKIRIAKVKRLDFYPKFDSEGGYLGAELEVPVVIVNDGARIGVLSDLHLVVVDPPKYHGNRIRTERELEKLPLTVKNQASTIFRIRTGKILIIEPEVKYKIDIIGETVEREIQSSFEFCLTNKVWKKIRFVKKHYTKMLKNHFDQERPEMKRMRSIIRTVIIAAMIVVLMFL